MLTFNEFQQQSQARPKFTGRPLVMLNPKATHETVTTYAKKASLRLASSGDYKKVKEDYTKAFDEGNGIVFEQLGIVVINQNKRSQISIITKPSSSRSPFIYFHLLT